MMWLVFLAAVAAPAAERGPWDNYSGPYKLVISWYQSDLTIVDYPSRARCEAAAKAVNDEVTRRSAEADVKFPGGTKIGISPNGAFCIPG